MTNSTEIPGLCDQLEGAWPESVQHAYWLGVSRARAHEYSARARIASPQTGESEMYIKLRDRYIVSAESTLADLKAALAQESAP